MERPRGTGEEPLRARPQSVRLQLRARPPPSPRTCARSPSAPRPTARSSARRPRTGSSASSPPSGLVSRAGIIPIAHSQDTAGPMARTVRDAAILLGALTGADERDAITAEGAAHAAADYTRLLDPDGLRGARIGVVRKFFGFNPRVDRLMEDALAEMVRRGAVLVDPAEIPHVGEYDESELEVLLFELKADLAAYLAELGPRAPRQDPGRRHRLQRGAPRAGDAVLRPGAVPARGREGAAHDAGLPRGAREEPPALARGRDRRGDGRSIGSTRWWRRRAGRPG